MHIKIRNLDKIGHLISPLVAAGWLESKKIELKKNWNQICFERVSELDLTNKLVIKNQEKYDQLSSIFSLFLS